MLRLAPLVPLLALVVACDSPRRTPGAPGGGSRADARVAGGDGSVDGGAGDASTSAEDADALIPAADAAPGADAPRPGDAAAASDAGTAGCTPARDLRGLVLNEVDYDQPGTDTVEFVEVLNTTGEPLCLDDVELVLVNGDGANVYGRVALAGPALDPGAYVVVAGGAVMTAPGARVLRFAGGTDQLQNGGPDGVLLRDRVTGAVLDALSYEGEIRAADVDGTIVSLVEGTPCGVQDNAAALSLGRIPDGRDTDDAFADWGRVLTPSPGAPNVAPTVDGGVSPDAGTTARAGVYLYTGAGGGGPSSDLYVQDIEDLYRTGGLGVVRSDVVPSDVSSLKLLVLLNPRSTLDPALVSAAQQLVRGGGRLLLVMEHCKNGCFGNAAEHNRVLMALPSSLRLSGTGGAPLSRTTLSLVPVPPLTTGVSSLVVYYSGSVTPGTGTALGTVPGGDVVIAYEAVGPGEVVAIADSSMLGYVLNDGDNRAFLLNLGR